MFMYLACTIVTHAHVQLIDQQWSQSCSVMAYYRCTQIRNAVLQTCNIDA